jgi:hypothetical protein
MDGSQSEQELNGRSQSEQELNGRLTIRAKTQWTAHNQSKDSMGALQSDLIFVFFVPFCGSFKN